MCKNRGYILFFVPIVGSDYYAPLKYYTLQQYQEYFDKTGRGRQITSTSPRDSNRRITRQYQSSWKDSVARVPGGLK